MTGTLEPVGVQAAPADPARVESRLEELERTYEWRADGPRITHALLAELPDDPANEVARARLTLLLVDDLVRDRGAVVASRVVVEVRDRAAALGDQRLHAGAEVALSVLFRKIGDPDRALQHAVAAHGLDAEALGPTLRCRLMLALADALDECGASEQSRPRYREALGRARLTCMPRLCLKVVNNWAYAELMAGQLEAALELAEQLSVLALEDGMPMTLGTFGTIAEVLHAAGRSNEAVLRLRERLEGDHGHVALDVAGAWLVLAQIERETGALEAADQSLSLAEQLIEGQSWEGLRIEVLGERAELLAARGDHAGALTLYRQFHHETLELRSKASVARSQTLHAVLEVDEARRDSARYREMSYRDPLTGLRNRRFVDEDLDRRLTRSGAGDPAAPLAVAMVDLDHFKRVNDECSHEAGDAVLVKMAAILEDIASGAPGTDGAYAARLGGEEFLLVLPSVDLRRALGIAEHLRQQVCAEDWSALAAHVPVAISVGVSASPSPTRPPPDRADLLRQADRHLYAAKGGGRNRVEPVLS